MSEFTPYLAGAAIMSVIWFVYTWKMREWYMGLGHAHWDLEKRVGELERRVEELGG